MENKQGRYHINRFERVIDGDTVQIQLDEFGSRRVRLSGIDSPESKQEGGAGATAFLRGLLKAGPFFVELTEPPKQHDRLHGLLYREGETDPLESINAKMVAAGQAHCYPAYHKIPGLKKLEEDAKKAKEGMWASSLNPTLPKDFRQGRQRTGSNRSGRWVFVCYDKRKQEKIFRFVSTYSGRRKTPHYGR